MIPRAPLLARTAVLVVSLAALASPPPASGRPAASGGQAELGPGLWIDARRGVVALAAEVLVKDDLLEYLLVGPHGATHESLFVTSVAPTLVNAALLAAGAEPGRNATWREPAGEEPVSDGEPPRPILVAPEGGPAARFLPYVGWSEAGEDYFLRVEDVVTNLDRGRSMRRHGWVYLGSRLVPDRDEGAPPVFVAEAEGNLVNIALFFEGNTLFTAALDACLSQTIWVANRALLPERGTPVVLLFSRERLERLPEGAAGVLAGAEGR